MMLKVGVTGGIGSGKTTVCKVFELLGIPVFYADDVAKSIMHTDQVLKTAILNTFGERAYTKEGTLNRSYISSLVFNSKPELEKLNSLVHPAVFRAFDNWLLQQKDAPYVIKEAALLFESDSYKMCDESILVIAPTETKISRVKLRDGISDEDVKLRMIRQFSDEVKIKFADHILNNDEKQLIIPKIIQLHQQFLTIRS
jgi:dephospho-CoA kinase